MLEPSTPEERCGCLGSMLGILFGGWLGRQHFDAHARQHRLDNPDAVIDGNQVLGAFGLGAFCGLFAGALVEPSRAPGNAAPRSPKTALSQGPVNFGLVGSPGSADNSATDGDSSIQEAD
jgi:hypothetical protein